MKSKPMDADAVLFYCFIADPKKTFTFHEVARTSVSVLHVLSEPEYASEKIASRLGHFFLREVYRLSFWHFLAKQQPRTIRSSSLIQHLHPTPCSRMLEASDGHLQELCESV
jgi:hypothetical protein